MKTRRIKQRPIQSKVIIFSGGIKEDVSQLELKGGNLLSDCINYEEVDGVYHGYASILGYEVYDGTELASEVAIKTFKDTGLNANTSLLIESDWSNGDPVVFTDSSYHGRTLNITGSAGHTIYHKKFLNSGIILPDNSSYIQPQTPDAEMSLEDKNFSFDFWLEHEGATAAQGSIISESDKYYINLESSGAITFGYSTNGSIYTTVTSVSTIGNNVFTHICIFKYGTVVYIAFDGIVDANTLDMGSDVIYDPGGLQTGRPTLGNGFTGFMDEFRMVVGAESSLPWIANFSVPIMEYTNEYYSTTTVIQRDDTAREARRDAIKAVGDTSASGPVLGIHYYEGSLYAARDNTGVTASNIYLATGSGWSQLTTAMNPGGTFRFTVGRFFDFGSLADKSLVLYCSGEDYPHYIEEGQNPVVITVDPEAPATDVFPTTIQFFKDRLFLGYPGGRVLFSAVGDPTDFDIASGAGEFFIPEEPTNMIISNGDSLVIFTKNTTHIVKTLADAGVQSSSQTFAYRFFNEVFSDRSGAYPMTAERILGQIIYMDDRGVSSLNATEAFGDFSAGVISKNVQNTLQTNRLNITCSVVNRETNQYRLFFNDGLGLYVTFDIEKKVKGITKISFPDPVAVITEGEDTTGQLSLFFGSPNGKVYKMESGTSFDGEEIDTRLSPVFYSYGTPTVDKSFLKATLEVQADKDTIFEGLPEFNYRRSTTPGAEGVQGSVVGAGGKWGADQWGFFIYGGAEVFNPYMYILGYGKNMSLNIQTQSKYNERHIINNVIVEYKLGNRST